MSTFPSSANTAASSPATNKNPVGDWDVDDLLFWRALESHAPIGGLLKQVLKNGWTLCIPPDTAIPIGLDSDQNNSSSNINRNSSRSSTNNNSPQQRQLVPMPTESFSKMHVLIPVPENGEQQQSQTNTNNNNNNNNNNTNGVLVVDLFAHPGCHGMTYDDHHETMSNNSSSSNNNPSNNRSFVQNMKTRAGSFFSAMKESISSIGKDDDKNATNNNSSATPRKSRTGTTTRSTTGGTTRFSTATNSNNTNLTSPSSNINNNKHFNQSRFLAGGKKDLVVYRRTLTEELELNAEHYYYDDDDDKNNKSNKNNNRSGQPDSPVLREICKKKRFSDDSHSKSLDLSDLGVLVADWGNKGQRTVARIVFEQKVVNTESKKPVTFLVLDRPLNAGVGAVPAHLRTFGFNGQFVTDAVEFLFDADSEFVNDEDSLFSKIEKTAAKLRAELDETYCCDDENEDDENGQQENENETNEENKQQKSQESSSIILDKVRDHVEDIINQESETWNMAIVPAAHPLSRKRLERSFQVAISSFLHSKIYQVVFSICSSKKYNPDVVIKEVNRWKEVRQKFDAVAGGDDDPVHLGLAADVWNSLRKYDAQLAKSVQRSINLVSSATNPFDKVQRLEQVYQSVVLLNYEQQTTTSSNNTSDNRKTHTSNQQHLLAADNVIPLLAYYLLRADHRCELLPLHLSYVRVFGSENVLGGASSNYEYALATLEVALSVAYSVFDPPPPAQSLSARSSASNRQESSDEDGSSGDDDNEQKRNKKKTQQQCPVALNRQNNNNSNNLPSSSSAMIPTPVVSSSSHHHHHLQPSLPGSPTNSSKNVSVASSRFEASVIRSTRTVE